MLYPNISFGRTSLALAMVVFAGFARAQDGGPLVEAAGSVGRYLGPQALGAIITVEGMHGMPQPAAWEFRVADAAAPNGIQLLHANAARATRRPAPGDGYPLVIPPAFFAWQSVKVDSQAAFQIANAEATKAMVGFNSVHYLLRARDGTNHPVWLLTLIDVEGRPVGRLEISAQSGALERRVWMRYEGPGRRELLRIEDSASPLLALQPAQLVQPQAPGTPVTPGAPASGVPGTPADTPPPAPDAAPIPVPPTPPSPAGPPPASGGYTPLP